MKTVEIDMNIVNEVIKEYHEDLVLWEKAGAQGRKSDEAFWADVLVRTNSKLVMLVDLGLITWEDVYAHNT